MKKQAVLYSELNFSPCKYSKVWLTVILNKNDGQKYSDV